MKLVKKSGGSREKSISNLGLIESGHIPVTIIRLALPMMVGMIAQLVYNMTDTFFVGQTGDANMVAGISLTFPIFMLSQGIGSLFGVGTASYISRKLGEKRHDEAGHANAVAFWTNSLVGIFLTIVLLVFKTPLLRFIGTSDDTFYHADNYFSIINIFIVFSMLSVALSGQIRSEGAAGKAMIGMLLGIILNIVLDPIFILVFNWGAAGAAWATIIGNVVSVCYFILHFVSENSVLSVKPKDFKPNKRMYLEIIKIGFPAALQNIIMSIALIFNNILAASYGDYVVAGNGISFRIVTVSFMLVMALAMGFQPFAGYNYGAKNFERIRGGFIVTICYTTILALIFLGIYRIWGVNIIVLFIRDAATIDAASKIMNAFILGIPFLGVQMTMSIAFQSFGKSREATIVTVVRPLVYIPALYILNFLWGFNGLIYAWAAADIVTTATAVLLGIPLFKEMDLFMKTKRGK
ncbi:MAG: MATE family efflux transporter [Treponema sp.]|jgi:putative MATE family efflux protein|nr:MATE family efflux transporter [Treponema sp.]